MQAAERIFDGEFSDLMDVGDDEDMERPQASRSAIQSETRPRMIVSHQSRNRP